MVSMAKPLPCFGAAAFKVNGMKISGGSALGAGIKRFFSSLVLLRDRERVRYLEDPEVASDRVGRALAYLRDRLRQLVSVELSLPGTYYQEVRAYPIAERKDLKAVLANERPTAPFPSERQTAILEVGERRSLVGHWYFPEALVLPPRSLLRLRIPASAPLLYAAPEGQALYQLGDHYLLTERFPDSRRCIESRDLNALLNTGLPALAPQPVTPEDLLWRPEFGRGLLHFLAASQRANTVAFKTPSLEARSSLRRKGLVAAALAALYFAIVTPAVYFGQQAAEAGAFARAEQARALRSELAKVERYNAVVDDVTRFAARTASLEKSFDLTFLLSRPPHRVETVRYVGGATEIYGFTPSVSELLATIENSTLECQPQLIRPVQRRGDLESFAVLCEGVQGL
jgi:hypothetical protein